MPAAHYEETTIASCGVPIVLSLWRHHPQAATIVFYPGTMASPLLYRALLTSLAERCNVVGIHLMSHGKSPRIKKSFRFADLLQNGLDAATWVREHWGGAVAVAGHSQGGILTLAHAAADHAIQAAFPLCLLLPHHPDAIEVTRFEALRAHREGFLRLVVGAARLFPRFPIAIPCYLRLKRVFAGAEPFPPVSGKESRLFYPLAFLASLFTADLRAACADGGIRCPVTVIAARNDQLFRPDCNAGMLRAVRAPHKELALLSGGGHLAPLAPRRAREIADIISCRCAAYGLPLVLGE